MSKQTLEFFQQVLDDSNGVKGLDLHVSKKLLNY